VNVNDRSRKKRTARRPPAACPPAAAAAAAAAGSHESFFLLKTFVPASHTALVPRYRYRLTVQYRKTKRDARDHARAVPWYAARQCARPPPAKVPKRQGLSLAALRGREEGPRSARWCDEPERPCDEPERRAERGSLLVGKSYEKLR
jgi:hypothetical protein